MTLTEQEQESLNHDCLFMNRHLWYMKDNNPKLIICLNCNTILEYEKIKQLKYYGTINFNLISD